MNSHTPSHLAPYNDAWDFLDPARRRLLEPSWAGVFRDHIWPQVPADALTACFTKTGGRPRKSPRLMLGVLMLQPLHDLTDAQTVDAIAFNLSWHYALDISPYSEIYICERTLRNYRQAVRDNSLAALLFQQLTDVLIQDFHIDTRQQRLDSTAVRSAIRQLSRLGIVVETVRKFIRELARREPALYDQVDSEIVRLYVERQGEGCFDWGQPGESKRRLPEALSVLWRLAQQFKPTAAARLPSYQLLNRVLAEQGEIATDPQGQSMLTEKAPADIPSDSVQHPADPDSSYNTHRGQGYMVQIMATYAEDDEAAGALPDDDPIPDLITHVAAHLMTQHDRQALEPAVADVTLRQIAPQLLLGDSHYGSTDHVAQLQSQGIELLAPSMPPKGAKQGQLTLEDFALDDVGRILACPQGHLPIWTSVSETRLAVRFDTTPCQQCPEMAKCPGYLTSRADDQRRWQYTHERVAQRQRRLDEQQPKFEDRYRWRAGIEATMSRLKHQMGLAHLRIRGMAAVKYHVFLRALGLNVLRIAARLHS